MATDEIHFNLLGVTSHIPKEGTVLSFNCTAAGEVKPKFWILPDGRRIHVNEQGGRYDSDQNRDNNQNLTIDHDRGNRIDKPDVMKDFDAVNVSANQLTILGIRRDMDGQYICVVEGNRQQIFFIPYVIAQSDYTGSLLISLYVSLGFAIACCFVLIFDRYFLPPGSFRRFFSRKIRDSSSSGSDQVLQTPSRKSNHIALGNVCGISNIDDFSAEQQENTCC